MEGFVKILDSPVRLTFADPAYARGKFMTVKNTHATLLHYVENEALKPGEFRIFLSTGKRWRRCRILEGIARRFPRLFNLLNLTTAPNHRG